MAKRRRSRLARKQEIRSFRKAVFFGFLTVLIALALVFLGIPAMIRLAIFLGDIRSSSQPVEPEDVLPPAPVSFQSPPEATNSAQFSLEGFAEQGATVEIFINDYSVKKVVAESGGTFQATGLNLKEGRNVIFATATDKTGNTSQASRKVTVIFDQKPPELEISSPEEGSEFSGDNEKRVSVKGKAEEGSTIMVNDKVVIVDFEGNFEYPLTLSEGENTIKILVTDKAGNQTGKEIKVKYSP
jgi:hypothetical protein